MRGSRGLIASTLALFALLAPISQAPIISEITTGSPSPISPVCGDIVPPGDYVMTANVGPCATDPALTLDGAVKLDMRKHTVSGNGTFNGVLISGVGGAVLRNGSVLNAVKGVVVAGSGTNIVSEVTSKGNSSDGFDITSPNNIVRSNSATGNGDHGFHVNSDGNLLIGNKATKNLTSPGYDVIGDSNRVSGNTSKGNNVGFVVDDLSTGDFFTGNTAVKNVDDGFGIRGNDNVFLRNVAIANGGDGFDGNMPATGNMMGGNKALRNKDRGIVVDNTGWTFVSNIALKNKVMDLLDFNGNCTANRWFGNKFKTKDPACIA